MTVQALIDELMKIKNKDAKIMKYDEAGGSYDIDGITGYKPKHEGTVTYNVGCDFLDAEAELFEV